MLADGFSLSVLYEFHVLLTIMEHNDDNIPPHKDDVFAYWHNKCMLFSQACVSNYYIIVLPLT